MRKTMILTVVAGVAMCSALATAMEETELQKQLREFNALAGKSWIGDFANSTPDNPLKDEVAYEYILNGHALRSVHTVTGGYGGETIIYWNPVFKKFTFTYYSNAGMYSEGTGEIVDGVFKLEAMHYGGATTAWTAEMSLSGEAAYTSSAKYFTNGKWDSGHEISYVLKMK